MIRKILALHLIILLILSGCAGTISTNSNQEENVASENSIVVTKQDQISLTQLIESLDQQDWYGAAESWKEIEYNNPELYSSLCVRYPKMQVALIGIDPDSDSFIYDVFFEKYPIHKVYANKEAKIADAMYYDYKMLVDLAVSEGFVERLNEDDINVTRELTKEEQLRVLDLHEMQTEIHLRETISDMYSELALGIGDTSEYDEEIYALEFAVNEIRIQKELTKILDFNTFTGDKTSNIILMAALRMQGIIYSQDQMLHAPQVYWPGRNMGDFSSYKDPLSQGYIKFQNTINLINPILLYRALQHPELKDVFDNEIAIASIMEIKRMIDNNEVTNIEVAFLAIEEKAAKRKKERTDEIEWKYYAGKDITLNWFDEFHPKRITNGQITLNGGFLDSNEFGEGNQAGDFTDVIIGRWGGVVQQAFKGYEHKWLFGSAYGNEGGTVTVTKGGVLDTRRPHLLPFDTYTVDTDKIVDRFRTEILVKSNPNLYIAMDKYIKSDIYLQGAVKLHSDSVSENEKNRIRYEIGIIFNENQYFDLAANVLKDVPAGTVLSGTTLVLSDELKSKYSGRTAGDLLDDIKGIGVFDLSSSTKKFWTDIGIYLINPAQWLVYGAIGRAGITVLSSFRTGRLILGAATRFGSNIYGFSWALERAGGNVIVSTVFRILGIVGEETFEELVGLIYPPLEPIAMIINGVDPWEAANPKLKLLGGAKFFGRTSIGGIDTDVYSMSKFDMLNLKAGEYDTDIGKVVLSWDEDAQVFYYDHPQTGNRIALGELGNVDVEFSIPGILKATDIDPKAKLRTEIDAETDIETKSKVVDQYNLAVYEQSGLDASAIADIEAHASDSNYVFYDNRWYTLDELREMKWTEKDIEESLIITHRMIENKLYPADYLYMDSNGNTFTDQEWLDRNPGVEMFVMDMDNSMFDASLLPKLSREFALHIKEHGVLPSEYIGKIKAFSGIPELISSIPKKRLMILSNGYGYYHRTVLKEIGLLDAFHNWNIVSSFDETARVIRTNDRTDPIWEKIARSIYSDYDPNLLEFDNANLRSAEGYIGKPNAYLFEKITAQKGIPSDKFVFVTDSASEIWPTQNIGWKTIYVKGFDQEWDEQMITGIPGFQDPEFVPDAIIRPNEMTKLGNIVETMDLRSQVRQAPDYESKLPLIKKLNARIRTQNGFTEAHIGDLHAHLEDGELFNNGEWYPIEEFKARDWTEKEIDEEFTKTHKYVEEALYPPDYVYMDKAGNTFTDQDWVEQHPGIDVVVLDIDNVILMKKESIRVSSYNYNYAKEHGVLPPEINENYFVSPGMPEFISTIPIKRRMILTNDYLYYQKTKLKSAGIDNEFMDWKMRGVGDEVVKIITIKDNSDPMWVQVQEYVNEEIEEGYSSDEFDFEHDDFVLNYVIRQLHLGKNGPNLFQRIMKQTDVVPERIFYVDDYGTAIQESTMLGWKTVYVKGFDSKPVTEAVTGTKAYPAEFPPTKVITIEEFNQLPEILWELSQVEQN